jgi:hypothetical protein
LQGQPANGPDCQETDPKRARQACRDARQSGQPALARPAAAYGHLDNPAAALGQFFDLFGEHCHLGHEPLAEDGAHDANDAVNEGVEATGRAVRGAARGTADALSWVLDVPGHVSRHPWLLVGAAVLVGFLIFRLRRRE